MAEKEKHKSRIPVCRVCQQWVATLNDAYAFDSPSYLRAFLPARRKNRLGKRLRLPLHQPDVADKLRAEISVTVHSIGAGPGRRRPKSVENQVLFITIEFVLDLYLHLV